MIKMIYLMVFLIMNTVGWNERTTCRSNNLGENQRFFNWLYASYFRKQLSRQKLNQIKQNLKFTGHYGKQILNSPIPQCANIIIHQKSCCTKQSFKGLMKSINQAYDTVNARVRYPIQHKVYQIYSQLKQHNCKPYPLFTLPQVDGFTFANSTQSISSLLLSYQELISTLKYHQKQFINETICVLCLGVKDFPNYIFPYKENFNSLIFNRQYFDIKTSLSNSLFLSLQRLHEKIKGQMIQFSQKIQQTTPQCQKIKKQMQNSSLFDQLILCHNQKECKKLAVLYFGDAVSPQNIRYIKAKTDKIQISPIDYYIYLSEDTFGFMGNRTQPSIFGIKTYPNTQFCQRDDCNFLWK